ncbi:MAG: EamA family transporter [Thermodesulfobacteriota bacterium]
MTQGALIALIVACIWGINPIFEKLSLKTATPYSVITIRFLFTAFCLAVITLTTGRLEEITKVDGRSLFWILLSGLAGGLIGLFLFFVALKQEDTSKVVPIVATFPMFTAIYAYFLLGETISLKRAIGILFVVIGAILINIKETVID